MMKAGLEQFFGQLIRPRLRALLDDCYRDVTYVLNESTFTEAEEGDLIRKRFIRQWQALFEGYRVRIPSSWLTRSKHSLVITMKLSSI
jgi:conserved oligomeric Golgi complex subunit 4